MKRIGTQTELDDILRKAEGESVDFYVLLKGGLRSSKDISLDENDDYEVLNEIDDSEETIKREDFASSTIGEAISKGAFFQWQF